MAKSEIQQARMLSRNLKWYLIEKKDIYLNCEKSTVSSAENANKNCLMKLGELHNTKSPSKEVLCAEHDTYRWSGQVSKYQY